MYKTKDYKLYKQFLNNILILLLLIFTSSSKVLKILPSPQEIVSFQIKFCNKALYNFVL